MPIYEYHCADCGRRSSVFFRSLSAVAAPVCPRCGGGNLTRLVSRVAVHRSAGDDAADDFGGEDDLGGMFDGVDEDDPRALAGAMRRMSEEAGEPLEPEMEEAMGRLERGEDPEQVMAGLDETMEGADDVDDEF